MRVLAKEENVPIADLNSITKTIFEKKGKDYTTYNIFMNLKPNEYINYPNGINDNTHLQDNGAQIIADALIEEIIKLKTTYPYLESIFNN